MSGSSLHVVWGWSSSSYSHCQTSDCQPPASCTLKRSSHLLLINPICCIPLSVGSILTNDPWSGLDCFPTYAWHHFTVASGIARHILTVCTYDFWFPNSKNNNTSLFQSNIFWPKDYLNLSWKQAEFYGHWRDQSHVELISISTGISWWKFMRASPVNRSCIIVFHSQVFSLFSRLKEIILLLQQRLASYPRWLVLCRYLDRTPSADGCVPSVRDRRNKVYV